MRCALAMQARVESPSSSSSPLTPAAAVISSSVLAVVIIVVALLVWTATRRCRRRPAVGGPDQAGTAALCGTIGSTAPAASAPPCDTSTLQSSCRQCSTASPAPPPPQAPCRSSASAGKTVPSSRPPVLRTLRNIFITAIPLGEKCHPAEQLKKP